jgi:gamma-glutamyltranspeptidase/glutathione hydrolase
LAVILKTISVLLFFALFVVPIFSWSQSPIIDYKHRFLPIIGKHGMVAASERLASEIGLQILKEGGNAIDAAVATGFALAVTYPRAGNLGGGGFMMVHLAESNKQLLIDYREAAPFAAHRNLYIDEHGKVDRGRAFFSHQAAGVPGTVAGLSYALKHYGTMSLSDVLGPAIRLAEQGFPVSYALDYEIGARAKRLRMNEAAAKIFFMADGGKLPVGSTWKQKDLATTLKLIAKNGPQAFYHGEIANKITADMRANNGLINKLDLAQYRVIEREPVRGDYRGFTVVTTPPPSSGGIHIVQMLNILEGYDLKSMGHNSADYIHLLAESMKLAYADRSQYLGDPDFYPVPTAKLTDKRYAVAQRKRIDTNQATPSSDIAPGRDLPFESNDTTHYTVADQYGNVVSNTYTLNFSFGSGLVVPGTGMLLNNEMADFSAQPGKPNPFGLIGGEANKIEPGKRPLSSMTPTFVFKDGQPWLATGSPGGSLIITVILQTLLNVMDFDMNIAAAMAEPRVHHQWMPDKLHVENGISPDTIKLLEKMQQNVVRSNRTLGRMQSIIKNNGLFYGSTDPRRPGGWVATY